MPLTAKGEEIMSSMKKEYGEEKGKEVFYASKNAGKISGVDEAIPEGPTPDPAAKDEAFTVAETVPASVTLKEMNERNRQYWEQPGGQMFQNK
jgi:hypothetical protein